MEGRRIKIAQKERCKRTDPLRGDWSQKSSDREEQCGAKEEMSVSERER